MIISQKNDKINILIKKGDFMIQRKKKRTANIGFFSVVHETYFGQFDGLEEKIRFYHAETIKKIADVLGIESVVVR